MTVQEEEKRCDTITYLYQATPKKIGERGNAAVIYLSIYRSHSIKVEMQRERERESER